MKINMGRHHPFDGAGVIRVDKLTSKSVERDYGTGGPTPRAANTQRMG